MSGRLNRMDGSLVTMKCVPQAIIEGSKGCREEQVATEDFRFYRDWASYSAASDDNGHIWMGQKAACGTEKFSTGETCQDVSQGRLFLSFCISFMMSRASFGLFLFLVPVTRKNELSQGQHKNYEFAEQTCGLIDACKQFSSTLSSHPLSFPFSLRHLDF